MCTDGSFDVVLCESLLLLIVVSVPLVQSLFSSFVSLRWTLVERNARKLVFHKVWGLILNSLQFT